MRRLIVACALFGLLAASAGADTLSGTAGSSGSGGPLKFTRLFTSLTVIGNGADLTEDTLVSYTIPANTLVNVGDEIHVIATGGFTGSTDAKTARVRIGPGVGPAAPVTTVATNMAWRIEVHFIKSALNTQQSDEFTAISGGAGTQYYINVQSTETEGTALSLTVTGQNTTNSVASSITVRTVTVDLLRV